MHIFIVRVTSQNCTYKNTSEEPAPAGSAAQDRGCALSLSALSGTAGDIVPATVCWVLVPIGAAATCNASPLCNRSPHQQITQRNATNYYVYMDTARSCARRETLKYLKHCHHSHPPLVRRTRVNQNFTNNSKLNTQNTSNPLFKNSPCQLPC